jgi:hypothetical protein
VTVQPISSKWRPERIHRETGGALYRGKPASELIPADIHFQTAAMTKRAAVLTTNFDPLIETCAPTPYASSPI